MREVVWFIIPSVFLYAYMLLSSIEFGAAIFQCWPRLLAKRSALRAYINPVWETTNVFLVFFIVSMLSFFPGASARFGTDLLLVLFSALVLFGLRMAGMLCIFYGDIDHPFVNTIFLIGSFGAPIILSLVFVYMLTGSWEVNLWTPLTLLIVGAVASAIVLLSATFSFWQEGTGKGDHAWNTPLWRLIHSSFYVFLACVLGLYFVLISQAPYLVASAMHAIIYFGLIAAAITFFMPAYRAGHRGLGFAGICGLVAAVFFSILTFHLPYIIYPMVTVYSAFTNTAAYQLMAGGFVVGMLLIIPALVALYKLALSGKNGKSYVI